MELQDLNLKFIEKRTGRVRSISWDEKWEKGTDPLKQLEYVKALASSQNEALELLQDDRNEKVAEISKLEQLIVNAEQALHIQKAINTRAITDMNARIHSLVAENQELINKAK